MRYSTVEGVVENGQIRLCADVTLPEQTRVYVLIPDLESAPRRAHVHSPRLAHPEQASDLAKQVIEEAADAGL
jgi:hypothetical protein